MLSFLDPTAILLGGVVLLCVWWWMSTRRPPGLPPGPGPALPLLGHLHLLAKDPRPQFWRWRRQYGDVFSLYMGRELAVVLASSSAIREALVVQGDVFADRPDDFVATHMFKGKGIAFSSGPIWRESRKIAVDILRTLGMGKNVLAERIQEEITHYIRAIKDHQGAPADLNQMTRISISNNVCSILFGKRYDYQDPEFTRYMQALARVFELTAGTAFLNFFPFLRHIPGDPAKAKELEVKLNQVFAFMDSHVADHLQRQEDIQVQTDYIDTYLRQTQRHNIVASGASTTSDETLQKSLVNLFAGGTETTSTALQWALLLFLHHTHVQDKCFQEINDVIGPDRLPSMQDRPNLTYLEATICEVLRKGDITPLSLPHATACDVTFRGYVIPKGATIIPALTFVHQDPEIWGDPENFRPERFIGPDGRLAKEELIPFSTGRRVCPGESVARMELFLYLATLIQHFRFLPPEEGQLPSLEGVFGMTYCPQPYKIRAVPRK